MTTPALPFDTESPSAGDTISQKPDATASHSDHSIKAQHSALWAAYGDALGWISELTDETGLKRRTDGELLDRPIAWKRRIGGRSGITASLPVGCYSDDTQLRLATGRAIRADGFDAEAFANVELPVWLSYELGGGRGTKAAATNLGKPKVPWFANTFKGWTESGGNGAAMRIQPHVWAACAPDNPDSFLPGVIRNAVCTHSHPIGMMGAVLHALTLAHTISSGHGPAPEDMDTIIDIAASVPTLMQNDFEVWNYWRTAFEREAGPFAKAWKRAVTDSKNAAHVASKNPVHMTGAERYSAIVDNLMLRERKHLGNGILTAIAAVGLTWCEARPEKALRVAANAIGTDTDTIATMAGAILGATAENEPPVEVMDADLLRAEAARLSEIACGGQPSNYQYPDLLHWSAPKTRSDALMIGDDGNLWVAGLGRVKTFDDPMSSPKDVFMWQWLKLEMGQTLFIKRRNTLPELDGISPLTTPMERQSKRPIDLEGALNYIKEHNGDDKAIGLALRGVVTRGTTGQIAAFTAALIDHLREAERGVRNTQDRPQ